MGTLIAILSIVAISILVVVIILRPKAGSERSQKIDILIEHLKNTYQYIPISFLNDLNLAKTTTPFQAEQIINDIADYYGAKKTDKTLDRILIEIGEIIEIEKTEK